MSILHYNRCTIDASVSVHTHCAPSFFPQLSPPRTRSLRALFASLCVCVRGEARLVSVSVCVCVCASRYLRVCFPTPRKSIQISNNGSTLHSRSRRRRQRSAICIFFSSFSFVLILSVAFGGAFALVCFIIDALAAVAYVYV